MADYLEDIYTDLAKKFAYSPEGPILLEIFNSHEMFSGRTVALPDLHTIGACTGRMVAMASPHAKGIARPFNWGRVLRHEMVHVFNLEQTHFLVPHWFTEGLAVSNEGYPRPQSWNELLVQRVPIPSPQPLSPAAGERGKPIPSPQPLSLGERGKPIPSPQPLSPAAGERGKPIPSPQPLSRGERGKDEEGDGLLTLDTIELGFMRPRSPVEWTLAYAQAQLYVEYLKEKFGAGAVGELLNAYREGLDTAGAIAKVCKVDKATFEKGYREHLEKVVKSLTASGA